jgi:hypothetical protein
MFKAAGSIPTGWRLPIFQAGRQASRIDCCTTNQTVPWLPGSLGTTIIIILLTYFY